MWSVSALFMLFLSVKASHALFSTIYSAERAFLVSRQSHPCGDIILRESNFKLCLIKTVQYGAGLRYPMLSASLQIIKPYMVLRVLGRYCCIYFKSTRIKDHVIQSLKTISLDHRHIV